jgi:hypothetical protein
MNSVRKILSVLIALTFLVSATGVIFVKHTCLHSGKTTILLGEKNDCYEQTMDQNSCCNQQTEDRTCPVHEDHQNCCVNDFVYLKGNPDYQKSETNLSVKLISFQLFEIKALNLIASSNIFNTNSYSPPVYNSPRDVLIKNNILIL